MSFLSGAELDVTTSTLADEVAGVAEDFAGLSEGLRKGKHTLEERVRLYGVVNGLKKDVEKVQKHLNSEIKAGIEYRCRKDLDGTLRPENDDVLLSQNDKGSIFVKDGEAKVELRAVSAEVFDEKLAEEALREAGLLEAAQETTRTIRDENGLLEAIAEVAFYLRDLNDGQCERADELESFIETTTALSKAKIEDLVRSERLDVALVPKMFRTEVSYRLYG